MISYMCLYDCKSLLLHKYILQGQTVMSVLFFLWLSVQDVLIFMINTKDLSSIKVRLPTKARARLGHKFDFCCDEIPQYLPGHC